MNTDAGVVMHCEYRKMRHNLAASSCYMSDTKES